MRFKWRHKLRSGALQFTVFISVLIALILAGVILLAYTYRFFIEQSKAIVDNIALADSGIDYLKNTEKLSTDTLQVAVPDTRNGQSVSAHLSSWGIFEKAFVKSTHRQKQFIKCALMGACQQADQRPALYLQETFNPLAVVGSTRIDGTVVLPAQGARTGSISGNSYYGKELVYGEVKKSTPVLPSLRYDYKENLKYYLYGYEPEGNADFIQLNGTDRITNSFSSGIKGIYANEPIVLENRTISGNIIIRSARQITVRPSAQLSDVILAAPVIIIEDGVKGTFQAIADISIRVGKDCTLNYPSALVMVEKENLPWIASDAFNNRVSVGDRTIIRGSLCYFDTTVRERDFWANIVMGSGSLLKGEVYCDGNLELRACTVQGSVYAKNLVTNEGGTTFVNHLYNVKIDSGKLPENFGGILLEKQDKGVMKWLN